MGIPPRYSKLKRDLKRIEHIDHFTPTQAAALLKRTTATLARWRKLGVGPEWKKHSDGWHILYSFDGLVDWTVNKQMGRRHRFTRLDNLRGEGYLTERDAAAFLEVSQATMVNWRKAGLLRPVYRASPFNLGGRLYLYRASNLIGLQRRIRQQRGLGRTLGSAGRIGPKEEIRLADV